MVDDENVHIACEKLEDETPVGPAGHCVEELPWGGCRTA